MSATKVSAQRVQIVCPGCGHSALAPRTLAMKPMQCPKCKRAFAPRVLAERPLVVDDYDPKKVGDGGCHPYDLNRLGRFAVSRFSLAAAEQVRLAAEQCRDLPKRRALQFRVKSALKGLEGGVLSSFQFLGQIACSLFVLALFVYFFGHFLSGRDLGSVVVLVGLFLIGAMLIFIAGWAAFLYLGACDLVQSFTKPSNFFNLLFEEEGFPLCSPWPPITASMVAPHERAMAPNCAVGPAILAFLGNHHSDDVELTTLRYSAETYGDIALFSVLLVWQKQGDDPFLEDAAVATFVGVRSRVGDWYLVLPRTELIEDWVTVLPKMAYEIVATGSCPRGHGALTEWRGKMKCFTCEWPALTVPVIDPTTGVVVCPDCHGPTIIANPTDKALVRCIHCHGDFHAHLKAPPLRPR